MTKIPPATVLIVTAETEEFVAVQAMLESPSPFFLPGRGGGRRLTKGMIPSIYGGEHLVALGQAEEGTSSAAGRTEYWLTELPTVRYVIKAGIAGGAPDPDNPSNHVRLGDVVVMDRLTQYDHETIREDMKGNRKSELRSIPCRAHPELTDARNRLEEDWFDGKIEWLNYIKRVSRTTRPGEDQDILFHTHDRNRKIGHPCDLNRIPEQPRLFFGHIASGNKKLESPAMRDYLRDKYGFKAFEMEAAGIAVAAWDRCTGFTVIAGVSDYCDRKSAKWKDYAAAVAAACTRALIERLPVETPQKPFQESHLAEQPRAEEPASARAVAPERTADSEYLLSPASSTNLGDLGVIVAVNDWGENMVRPDDSWGRRYTEGGLFRLFLHFRILLHRSVYLSAVRITYDIGHYVYPVIHYRLWLDHDERKLDGNRRLLQPLKLQEGGLVDVELVANLAPRRALDSELGRMLLAEMIRLDPRAADEAIEATDYGKVRIEIETERESYKVEGVLNPGGELLLGGAIAKWIGRQPL